MGDVIRRDFGKEDREAARAFARLMNIAEEIESDILNNPGKYLAMASARLAEAEQFKARLYHALHLPWAASALISAKPPTLNHPSKVTIDRRDYDALWAVRQIIDEH